jgi:dTMP kinase
MKFLAGKFIVLDGGEACGKSTQAAMLRQRLEQSGAVVVAVRDPGSTPVGEAIRGILLDPEQKEMTMRCEMLLYMAARAQMMGQIILPALQKGAVVICDRFVTSTLAYQSGGDGLGDDEIRRVAEVAIRGRWPDLTLILDLPVDIAAGRMNRKKDRIESRPREYHEQVRQRYLKLAQADPRHVKVIDATAKTEIVGEAIWHEVSQLR